jgi:hypothetical protein
MTVTRTPRTFNAAVIVDATHGDRLTYRVTVRGATPGRFALIDGISKKLIWSSKDGSSLTVAGLQYEREWPRPVDDVHVQTSHTLGLQFLGVREVRYEIELSHLLGSPEKIFDIEYHATGDADSYFEDLMVTTF